MTGFVDISDFDVLRTHSGTSCFEKAIPRGVMLIELKGNQLGRRTGAELAEALGGIP